MKKFLSDLIARLSSRKFLLAVATGYILYANGQYTELLMVVLGYLGAEGAKDVVQAYSTTKFVDAPRETLKATDSFFLNEDDEDVDRTTVVAGP